MPKHRYAGIEWGSVFHIMHLNGSRLHMPPHVLKQRFAASIVSGAPHKENGLMQICDWLVPQLGLQKHAGAGA
jgi:hypothetical protein